ncbi:MAG: ABC transporter ATP-binding protein [Beijerinckiaceae bacterium]|nr:ABC transporter ATP-binding protein [Beijerinckiaceae bacterium]
MSTMRAIGLDVIGMSKRFGALAALDNVSLKVPAGTFHALLGENGAGKSTLVKCIMGFYQPDSGQVLVDGQARAIRNPREAAEAGIGMVYQHFTLVPSLTGAENLVLANPQGSAVIDWRKENAALDAFLARMPFRVPLDRPVAQLSAGEKQKLEILKQLYLDQRFIILDEPTSVLTPAEADEVLGLMRDMTRRGEVTVLMISHKFREVTAFADDLTVLRKGALVGSGRVIETSHETMAAMMIGDTPIRERADRVPRENAPVVLDLAGLFADADDGRPAIEAINLKVHAGEIVGIAGVSGNGQSALVEVLSGQRPMRLGQMFIHGEDFMPNRHDMARFKVFGLPEEPLKNATVPTMSVAENIAFRTFDRPPIARLGWWLSQAPLRAQAEALIARYRVKTAGPQAPIATLSGGNVQRAILARELSGEVDVLVVANPCFGLDFASVAEIRAQIMDQRNRGAAILLVSEDLDEILGLSDRVAVMSGGRITYVEAIEKTDRATIGSHMAGGGH